MRPQRWFNEPSHGTMQQWAITTTITTAASCPTLSYELRVRALESILVEKGYVDPAAIDALVETYESKVGPHNGDKVVAKVWAVPAYLEWLLRDASVAIAALGYTVRQGEHMVAVENTPAEHNLVVCTLCSCYP